MCQQEDLRLSRAKDHKYLSIHTQTFPVFGVARKKKTSYPCSCPFPAGPIKAARWKGGAGEEPPCHRAARLSRLHQLPQLKQLRVLAPRAPRPASVLSGAGTAGCVGAAGNSEIPVPSPPSDRVYPHFMTPVSSLCSTFHFYRKHSVFSLRQQQAINPSCLAAVLNIAQKSHTFQNHWVCNETEPRSHFEVPAFAVTKRTARVGSCPVPPPRVTAQPSRANGTVTLSAVEMPPE